MLSVIYHKTFKETGLKKCLHDDICREMLDYIEWFDSPDLIDRKEIIEEKIEKTKRSSKVKKE